jgi:hypothetical protein
MAAAKGSDTSESNSTADATPDEEVRRVRHDELMLDTVD